MITRLTDTTELLVTSGLRQSVISFFRGVVDSGCEFSGLLREKISTDSFPRDLDSKFERENTCERGFLMK